MMTSAKLDPRLSDAGMSVTVSDLAQLWADHTPPVLPVPQTCRACGHAYSEQTPLCPTAAVVRPLLRRRRHEGSGVLNALTINQTDDLLGRKLSTSLPVTGGRF